MSLKQNLTENLMNIKDIICRAAKTSGRSESDIQLVGVTKSVGVQTIRELMALGVTCFGENRVQEFLPKYETLAECPQDTPNIPNWHFIGHLQRNKVKFIIDKVSVIHSVDSYELAAEIDKRASQAARVMDILVEINIANEASKHGVAPTEAKNLVKSLAAFKHINVKGLMCIAPYVENAEFNRQYFKMMRNILLDIKSNEYHNLTELSMGMSGDYAVAIEEGATIVRIGSALVG